MGPGSVGTPTPTRPGLGITGDARRLGDFDVGPVDLCLTSPPYMNAVDHRQNPLTGYQTLHGNYRLYLDELAQVGPANADTAHWADSKKDMALRILSSQTVLMAQVDPDDDEIERFVVRRYAYDPARRERRNMIVAAFDNSLEFEAAIHAAAANLRRRRESGEDVDSREHVSGIVLEPGDHRKQQAGRTIKRGATLDAETWDRLGNDLPSGMGVVRFESDPHA